ncbi:hypothetical protein [Lactiplantibacillus plantarum]
MGIKDSHLVFDPKYKNKVIAGGFHQLMFVDFFQNSLLRFDHCFERQLNHVGFLTKAVQRPFLD